MDFQTTLNKIKTYQFANKQLSFHKSYLMGILNVTPDSFSDGGKYLSVDKAVNHGNNMIEQGADIIDVGGESTRPGAQPVSVDEELDRVIPVIQKIRDKNPAVLISIDTTKESVAREALKNGAQIVNDISGLTFEPSLLNTVKEYDAGIVIMHMKGEPKTMQNNPVYGDVIGEISKFLYTQSHLAEYQGISKIFIDPGIGFGKSVSDNYKIINELDTFSKLNYPVMIGLSRKSFIRKSMNLNIEELDGATAVLNGIAISKGARIIRTHNVKFGVQTCKLLNELITNNG